MLSRETVYIPNFIHSLKRLWAATEAPIRKVERKLNGVVIRITCETSVLILWFAGAGNKKLGKFCGKLQPKSDVGL